MITVSQNALGAVPCFYGKEPPEGRKAINYIIDWSKDQDYVFDLTLVMSLKRFSTLQQVLINASATSTAGFDVYLDGNKIGTLAAGASPIVYPLFGSNWSKLEFKGGGTTAGTATIALLNFAASQLTT